MKKLLLSVAILVAATFILTVESSDEGSNTTQERVANVQAKLQLDS